MFCLFADVIAVLLPTQTNPKSKFVNMRAVQAAEPVRKSQTQPAAAARDDMLGSASAERAGSGSSANGSTSGGGGGGGGGRSAPPTLFPSSVHSASPPPQTQTQTQAGSASASSSSRAPVAAQQKESSVEDFLSDLDAALMPSPRDTAGAGFSAGACGFGAGSGGGFSSAPMCSAAVGAAPPASSALSTPPGSAHSSSALSTPGRASASAGSAGGSSMQQRMFPAMSSPGARASPGSAAASPDDRLSSSFDSPDKDSPAKTASKSLPPARHTVAAVGVGANNSAAPKSGFTVESIGAGNGVTAGKTIKCTRANLAGSAVARGVKSSAFSKW
jgi:hypothetical protein